MYTEARGIQERPSTAHPASFSNRMATDKRDFVPGVASQPSPGHRIVHHQSTSSSKHHHQCQLRHRLLSTADWLRTFSGVTHDIRGQQATKHLTYRADKM